MLAVIPTGKSLLTLAGLVVLILAVKAFVVGVVMRLFRQSNRVAVATGLSLAQIGEFSFVLLAVGVQEEVVSDETFRMLQTASVVTLVLTPYLIAAAARVAELIIGATAARTVARAAVSPEQADQAVGGPVIVVGYGPAGQNVVRQLRVAGLPFLVLDMNPRTVEIHRSTIPIEFGDATNSEISPPCRSQPRPGTDCYCPRHASGSPYNSSSEADSFTDYRHRSCPPPHPCPFVASGWRRFYYRTRKI